MEHMLKDFVKTLNVPFAYNYPRYKNLSIDELFDKNNTRKSFEKFFVNFRRIELDK